MKYVIANWKAHKNYQEVNEWCNVFLDKIAYSNQLQNSLKQGRLSIIICPPDPFIALVKARFLKTTNIFVGVQSLSQYDDGAYTGETTARMVAGVADYSLIGHSERRQLFNETNEVIAAKTAMAFKYMITPLVCVRTIQDTIPAETTFVVYEPVWAIGTGKNEQPKAVVEMKQMLKIGPAQKFIYGGSVTPENCMGYLSEAAIDGILPGKASLDPQTFYEMVSQVV